eukprot:8623670-Ditylum_brightwellii.AAC.1
MLPLLIPGATTYSLSPPCQNFSQSQQSSTKTNKQKSSKKDRLGTAKHSHFSFYAVKRGLQQQQLHTSWDQAKQEVLDPNTQHLFTWAAVCKFHMYDSAMSFLG